MGKSIYEQIFNCKPQPESTSLNMPLAHFQKEQDQQKNAKTNKPCTEVKQDITVAIAFGCNDFELDVPQNQSVKELNCYTPKRRRNMDIISPAAVKWIRENIINLRQCGWTSPELYRRNKSQGIAWFKLWEKDDLVVKIKKNGNIKFSYSNAVDQLIIQTAYPRETWGNTNQKSHG
jgi:hypothetical protein